MVLNIVNGFFNIHLQLLVVCNCDLQKIMIDSELTFFLIVSFEIATIVAGTLAERCQMNAYLLFSMILTGFGKMDLSN